MIKLPRKIKEAELEIILQSDIHLPKSVSVDNIETDLVRNSKIDWTINPYVLKENFIRHFDTPSILKIWRQFKWLNWTILFFLGTYSFYTNDLNYLLTISIFIILNSSGFWDYWIFIIIWTGFILFGQIKSIDNAYYWLNICVAFVAFNLSKLTRIIAERKLTLHIKSNYLLFYKCYLYEIIDTYSENGNLEIDNILKKNNELSRQNTAANKRFGNIGA